MLYFGQELGERGMDEEGFSGRDGRTTIFDYWTVDTVRRWRNGGKFGSEHLTDEENALRNYYSRVLHLCNEEMALCEGEFFDIMYANYDNAMMNTHRQYAFLRKSSNSLVLVVANFDEQGCESSVIIPRHAFDYFLLPVNRRHRRVLDLLTGKLETHILHPDCPIELTLPPLGGKVLKFNL